MGDFLRLKQGAFTRAGLEAVRALKAPARLFGIRKGGDRYGRTLLIYSARAVLSRAVRKTDARSRWIGLMWERRHPNAVAVALGNKTAQIIWSLLPKDQEYQSAQEVSFS